MAATDVRNSSGRQAPRAKIFISYSRKDAAFADRIETAIRERGFEPLIDRSEIYAFEDWWKRIEALIARADTVVFVLSPDAVASEVCSREVAFAASLNKRLAPIVFRRVADEAIPATLRRLNFVLFDDEARFDDGAERLAEALSTDIEWIRRHTEIGESARRWSEAGRPGPRGLLLRSPMLEEAERWIASRPEGAPAPTESAQAFIAESRRAATRRRNIITGGLTIGLLTFAALAVLSTVALYIAEIQRNDALIAQSRFLARDARAATADGNATLGMLLALEALPGNIGSPGRPFVKEAAFALEDARANNRERLVLGPYRKVDDAGFSPDGKRLVIAAERDAIIRNIESGEQITLRGHADVIWSAKFSPDGALVVTASEDKTARVWDAATGAAIAVLAGHEGSIDYVAFSPDGAIVVTTSSDNSARLWKARSGEVIHVLRDEDRRAAHPSFSPDGERVLTASERVARIWDVKSGAVVTVLKGHGGPSLSDPASIFSLHYSADGTKVVTASGDKTARVWDAKTGASIAVLSGHENFVLSAAFSPDGTRVATSGMDRTARLWDATNGELLAVLRGHESLVGSVVFSPDGTRLLTASDDGTARIWDAAPADFTSQLTTGMSKRAIAVLRGHDSSLKSAVFSPDGERIVTASRDGTARLWSTQTGATISLLRGHKESVSSADFSPDGRRVLTASWDATARVWDTSTGAVVADLRGHRNVFSVGTKPIESARFSADGARVITASSDRTARIWNAVSGAVLAVLEGHRSALTSASFSPDGSRALTASEDQTVRVWDLRSGAATAVLQHGGRVSLALFSPDGLRILTSSWDGSLRLWDATAGTEIVRLVEALRSPFGEPGLAKDVVSAAAFSPDGKLLVAGSSDRTARVWDARSGEMIASLRGHVGPITAVAFSADSRLVATASIDRTARIWDAESGDAIAVLEGHDSTISSVEFSRDGVRVVTASQDRTARIWDTATGALISVLRGHDQEVASAAFAPDGVRVVTASQDMTARIWTAPRCQILIDGARHGAPRVLSASERSRFFLAPQSGARLLRLYGAVRPWIAWALPTAGDSCGPT